MTISVISDVIRLFVLCVTVLGFALACGALLSAHLDAAYVDRNGARRALAKARRASEAWSFVAQLTFVFIGFSFIVFPPNIPTNLAQIPNFVDGLMRISGFGIGALALAAKSLIAMVSETRIMRSL